MKKKIMLIGLTLATIIGLMFTSCGNPGVSIGTEYYEPKIAVEAILIPGQPVKGLYIWKNFSAAHNVTDLALPDAQVSITDLSNDTEFLLEYNHRNATFEDRENNLQIDYGKSYRLDVTASFAGKDLWTSSTTTVPLAGFGNLSINYDSLKYRQRNANGDIINFNVAFDRSPGTNFYLVTVRALDASELNFIYDNPFADVEPEDVRKDLKEYAYNFNWIQDTPTSPGRTDTDLFWFMTWFYTRYEVVVFAADRNYRDFIRTYNDVKEIDGNFHEPKFYFEGDGIGVFGSAVADTIYMKVVQ